ncbi:MAG: hypothetical protein ACKPCM_14655 [Pseudanabaena sp.]
MASASVSHSVYGWLTEVEANDFYMGHPIQELPHDKIGALAN